jgi:hypothetical protein
MSRRSLVSVLAVVPIALAAGAFGCTRSNLSTLEFGALCSPTDDCTFSDTCDLVNMSGRVWVDLQYTSLLAYPIEVFNQRPNNQNVEAGVVNTNNATIDRFEMRYEADGATIPAATSRQTVKVPADGNTVAMPFLIPAGSSASAAMAALPAGTIVIIELKARGTFDDGTEFETGEHPIPVELRNGQFLGYSCTDTTQTVTSICPENPGQSVNFVCE